MIPLNTIINEFSGIDYKKLLNRIFIFICGTILLIAFIYLTISLLLWGREGEREANYYIVSSLLTENHNIAATLFAAFTLQLSAFFLILTPLWKRNWFRIFLSIAMISYPIVLWIFRVIAPGCVKG